MYPSIYTQIYIHRERETERERQRERDKCSLYNDYRHRK